MNRHLFPFPRCTPAQRAALAACFLSVYLAHIYAFTNLIPHSDGLSRMFDPQQMTISGRWFLHYASMLNGFTQAPALIGFLSALFLALTAVLAVSLLDIKSPLLAGLAGVCLGVFPAMGYTFLYLFTASAYCLAILLSALSVWLAARRGWGWFLAGSLALALSMGTYQAYAAVAVTLSVLLVLRQVLREEATFASTARLGGRLVGFLALGAALYYLILQVFLKVKGLELLDYLGMSEAGSGYPIARLPSLILSCYKQVIAFFLLPTGSNPFTTLLMAALDLLAVVLAAGLFCFALTRPGLARQRWRWVGGLAMLALLPLAMAFAQVISPFSQATPIMKYAYVGAYLAVLLLAQQGLSQLPTPSLRPMYAWLTVGCLAALCFHGAFVDNLLYTASAQAHRATESYATRLAGRIESCEGYEDGMEVLIIGAFPTDRIYADVESYALIEHYSAPTDTVAPLNKHIYYYLNDWLNLPWKEPDEALMLAVSQSAAFQDMPLYPSDGSVQVLDGRVVVKVQETYTPKSDYELAYENRR